MRSVQSVFCNNVFFGIHNKKSQNVPFYQNDVDNLKMVFKNEQKHNDTTTTPRHKDKLDIDSVIINLLDKMQLFAIMLPMLRHSVCLTVHYDKCAAI